MLTTVILPHSLLTSANRPLASATRSCEYGVQELRSPIGRGVENPEPVNLDTTGV